MFESESRFPGSMLHSHSRNSAHARAALRNYLQIRIPQGGSTGSSTVGSLGNLVFLRIFWIVEVLCLIIGQILWFLVEKTFFRASPGKTMQNDLECFFKNQFLNPKHTKSWPKFWLPQIYHSNPNGLPKMTKLVITQSWHKLGSTPVYSNWDHPKLTQMGIIPTQIGYPS